MRSKLKKIIISFAYFCYKIIRKPIKWYWKIFKIQTQGVRVLIVCNGEIVIVKHWYNPLWVTPGGGINKYETPEQAAIREVREETGIEIEQLDYLLGIYSNNRSGKRDTVYCYVVNLDKKPDTKKSKFNIEIASCVWKSINNLPSQTSSATLRRISEYKNKEITKDLREW